MPVGVEAAAGHEAAGHEAAGHPVVLACLLTLELVDCRIRMYQRHIGITTIVF
jgi:hypothetical protein